MSHTRTVNAFALDVLRDSYLDARTSVYTTPECKARSMATGILHWAWMLEEDYTTRRTLNNAYQYVRRQGE